MFHRVNLRALWVLTVALIGSYFVSGTADAAATSAPCLPKVQWQPKMLYGALPAGVSTRYDTFATWVCELPTGYVATSWLFAFSSATTPVLNYARGLLTKAAADADCAATCVDPTPTEQAFIQQQLTANVPKAVVSFNGAKSTRAVYIVNVDGTLNPTPVPKSSIAVAASCNSGQRIAGTSYYDVSGQANASQAGQVLANGAFAICTVSLPIGAN